MHLFVATLGYSRRTFAKAYAQETQVEWLDGMEATFAYFGGVPTTDRVDARRQLDNAKALVATPRQDTQSAAFNERVQAFARYWGFTPRECRPYRARTKGKVERSVGYVKANAPTGRSFASWDALDRHQRRMDKAHFQLGATPADSAPRDRSVTRPLTIYAEYAASEGTS